jgi:hypothetical protein
MIGYDTYVKGKYLPLKRLHTLYPSIYQYESGVVHGQGQGCAGGWIAFSKGDFTPGRRLFIVDKSTGVCFFTLGILMGEDGHVKYFDSPSALPSFKLETNPGKSSLIPVHPGSDNYISRR